MFPQCEGGVHHPLPQHRLCHPPEEPPEGVIRGQQRWRSLSRVSAERARRFLFGTL